MKIQLYGKVISRAQRKMQDGSIKYYIVIEEPGIYPSRFQLESKDVSMFGQKDGPTGIGKMVTATAFANGREREVEGKNGKFTAYRVWFTLTKLEPAESTSSPAAATPQSDDQVNEDLLF